MADPFERMHARLLKQLGVSAILRDDPEPVVVIVEHGVAMSGEYGEVVAHRSIADIPSNRIPKSGDSLQVGAKLYTIESTMEDDGFMTRCVVR